MERRNAWLSYNEADEKRPGEAGKGLSHISRQWQKAERECVSELSREAEAAGYVSLDKNLASGEKIQTGDKIYAVGMKNDHGTVPYRRRSDGKRYEYSGRTHRFSAP